MVKIVNRFFMFWISLALSPFILFWLIRSKMLFPEYELYDDDTLDVPWANAVGVKLRFCSMKAIALSDTAIISS